MELVLNFGFVYTLLKLCDLEIKFLGLLGYFLHLLLELVFKILDLNFVGALVFFELHKLGAFPELILDIGLEGVVLKLFTQFFDHFFSPQNEQSFVFLDVLLVTIHVWLVLQLVAKLDCLLFQLLRDSLIQIK